MPEGRGVAWRIIIGSAVLGTIGLAQSGHPQTGEATIIADASPVEQAILQRLDRIERGLFREGSTLPRSVNDSIEQRIERLGVDARGGGGADAQPAGRLANDATRLRELDQDIRDLGSRIEREVERPIDALVRRVTDIERGVDRLASSGLGGLPRDVENLRRGLDRIERQLASIERRIR